MLAWVCNMKTPQYPEGRDIVIIANDVTYQSGSFGVLEDEFFFKASEYARERGVPRVFISCNSGARIGLVEELKPKFKVAWKDDNAPALGYEYLYLTEADYKALPEGTVIADPRKGPNGEVRYALDAIIGTFNGIGVENLRGSGLIAGETSRAYDETFTLSYVTGRSVGIGAYLNRLGQRVIQMQQGPMILTGFSALNKLLGKEVYTSQDQLGGPQIMYPNGVTHEVVANDREGMQSVVDWLSYTPKDFWSVTPPLANNLLMDPPERLVDFLPTKTPYDPRHMLGGTVLADGSFVSGFFDKGSFKEYLGGWGKSVVTGRARLGGINVGVIAVETRLVEQRIPADPGNAESREAIQPQAGQVWYPDSAYKTAQSIQDFNRGENLPLIIFANWRGFSGGTRDMYGEILKFGAMIVDALRTYRHPVFVYIPPGGELRGGAWVVIDPTINPQKMEMFADKEARGGILEPPGICEVKFRGQEQLLTMHRLDAQLQELDEALSTAFSEAEKGRIAADIKAREKTLAPLYMQVAHEFADLHDRAGRMKAKGCISEVLEWRTARGFFYWRILRRQKQDAAVDSIVKAASGALSHKEATEKVRPIHQPCL
jgi:acetyl-CoA carboxylase/biotin carboxylase 1